MLNVAEKWNKTNLKSKSLSLLTWKMLTSTVSYRNKSTLMRKLKVIEWRQPVSTNYLKEFW